jgi:energy-coupling factor transport system ATP-binding protein
MKPKLIVLDEPTSNLDPVATRRVHELVLALRDQGMTVLLVTRELDEFLAQADQLLVLDEGRLLAAGEPRVVLREHGAYLVDRLGIWLPETSEVGIALQAARYGVGQPVPITVPEAVAMVQASGLLQPVLQGKPSRAEAIAGETLVTARNLTFAYGDSAQALKGVTLAVRAGEMLAIVGRNGAGKSTLARLMVGLQKPQGGELTLFGQDARRWKVQDLSNQVALVFQNPEHQFLTDTVSEEIEYSLLSHGMTDPDERKRAIEGHLQTLGLISAAGAHPFALSAGMKRRLGVATMLVGQPRILIVDEPTYGQDQQMTHTLMERLEQIRAQGIAIVMVTHDMRLVQEYAERVVVMSEGLILFDGSPGRLFECPDVLEAANLRPTLLQEMVQALQGQGVRVEGDLRSTADFLDALFAQTEVRDGQR